MEKCKTATNSHLNVAFEIFSSLPTKGVRSQGHRRVRIYKKKIDFRRLGNNYKVYKITYMPYSSPLCPVLTATKCFRAYMRWSS